VRLESLPIGAIFTELLGMNVAGREDKPENPLLPIGLITRPPLGELLMPCIRLLSVGLNAHIPIEKENQIN
jgi:hypothetical protein